VRRKLARLIFQNPKKRKALEAIIHPYVFRRMEAILRRYPRRIHLMEVPLLFETGYDRRVDRTVVVTAPQTVQSARAARRLGIPRGEARARIRSQWPLRKKAARADYVIRNDRSLATTRAQVRAVWQKFLRQAERNPSTQ
jgi:dephospho-CoA kinase